VGSRTRAPSRVGDGADPTVILDRTNPNRAALTLTPADPVHRLALGQFVGQLVQVANLPHQRIVDVFDAHPTQHTGDQREVVPGLVEFEWRSPA